jgi:hypothetical protein
MRCLIALGLLSSSIARIFHGFTFPTTQPRPVYNHPVIERCNDIWTHLGKQTGKERVDKKCKTSDEHPEAKTRSAPQMQ